MALEPFHEKSPPAAGRNRMGKVKSMRSGVLEAPKPGSSRWMARAALVLGGRPGTPYLCGHGCRGRGRRRRRSDGTERWRSAGRAVRPEAEGSEAARGELTVVSARRPAGVHWLAKRRSRSLLKRRSHSWGFLWPMGGRRAGSGGGGGAVWVPLSAPRCLAHNFPARRGRGATGVGPRSTGTSQKIRCPPTRPWRSWAQHFGSGAARPRALCAHPEPTGLWTPTQDP